MCSALPAHLSRRGLFVRACSFLPLPSWPSWPLLTPGGSLLLADAFYIFQCFFHIFRAPRSLLPLASRPPHDYSHPSGYSPGGRGMHSQLDGESHLLRVLGARCATPSATGFSAPRVQPAIPRRLTCSVPEVVPRLCPHADQIGRLLGQVITGRTGGPGNSSHLPSCPVVGMTAL